MLLRKDIEYLALICGLFSVVMAAVFGIYAVLEGLDRLMWIWPLAVMSMAIPCLGMFAHALTQPQCRKIEGGITLPFRLSADEQLLYTDIDDFSMSLLRYKFRLSSGATITIPRFMFKLEEIWDDVERVLNNKP